LPSSRPQPSARRSLFLRLAGEIEGQLREAYHRRFQAGQLNQSSLAERLDVGRSVISRRLNGRTNMTIETIADMAWALDLEVEITIRDKRAAGPASAEPVPALMRSEAGRTR
jgi:transcriptional regulator with XRE-family HTH domain